MNRIHHVGIKNETAITNNKNCAIYAKKTSVQGQEILLGIPNMNKHTTK